MVTVLLDEVFGSVSVLLGSDFCSSSVDFASELASVSVLLGSEFCFVSVVLSVLLESELSSVSVFS